MKAKNSDWYKNIWTLNIKNDSWVEDTQNQVEFIIKTLDLKGNERILDLACGFGRHALSFARKGFRVTGVDITKAYIEDAICTAKAEHAEHFFPTKRWEEGQKTLALSQFEWDKETRRMLYGGWNIPYGAVTQKPEITHGDPTRLYSIDELRKILQQRQMKIISTFSDFYGKEESYNELQLLVYSTKM